MMTQQSVHQKANLEPGPDAGAHVIDLDAGRRAFIASLGLGTVGAALMGLAPGLTTPAMAAAVTDVDIINFALNLEYLEAQFYSFAAFGHGLDSSILTGGTGAPPGTVSGGRKVPFQNPVVAAYAQEIANDEMNHVKFFRSAAGLAAVSQPALNIGTAFNTAAMAAGIVPNLVPSFDAYANDLNFLIAAYIFEDVGVTAFHGAAPLIQSKTVLSAAASVLAVEAYHAGLIRTVLFALGSPGFNQSGGTIFTLTSKISALRASLSGAAPPDDQGIAPDQSTLSGGAMTPANIVPTDAMGVAFARSTRQVLNIVYGQQNTNSGLFFPNGLNGNIR